MPPVPLEEGDFSTPLRFGRNDGRGARQHRHLERRYVPVWETDGNRSDDTLSREISRVILPVPSEGGDFSTLWRLCIESPSQPKLASSLHNKRLSYWRLTGFRRNDGGCGPAFLKSVAKPPPRPFEPFESSVPYHAVAPKSC